MATNKGITIEFKQPNGYIDLYPKTVPSQILGWNVGEIYGPYTLVLEEQNWANKKLCVTLDGVEGTDVITCTKVLTGTKEEQILQDYEFSLLQSIESNNNQICFTCKSTPSIDLQVQIYWTR